MIGFDQTFNNQMVVLSGERYPSTEIQHLIDVISNQESLYLYKTPAMMMADLDTRLSAVEKLPEKNIYNAWNKLIKIYNIPGSLIDLQIIDLYIL